MQQPPTKEQIAHDFDLWVEHVDVLGLFTRRMFEATSVEDKLKIIEDVD